MAVLGVKLGPVPWPQLAVAALWWLRCAAWASSRASGSAGAPGQLRLLRLLRPSLSCALADEDVQICAGLSGDQQSSRSPVNAALEVFKSRMCRM